MNEPEKKQIPITDAEHLLEADDNTDAQAPVVAAEPVAEPAVAAPVVDETPEVPVKQLQEQPAVVAAPTPPPQAVPKEGNSGGVLVLQWLTYAFWFWFTVSISWLAGVVINFFVAGSTDYSDWGLILAYPLASVLIMLAMALVADFFYAKREPAKKVGGANVIMLLHVVPFVLIAIGSLVTIVFSLINMTLNSSPLSGNDGPLQVMLVAAVVTVVIGLAAARAFFGSKRLVRIIARVSMGVIALGFIIASIAGPAVEAVRTKDDRLIESALPSLASDIREYTSDNDKLPASLADVTHTSSYYAEEVQLLIDSGLVKYKANTIPAEDGNSYSPESSAYSGVSYRYDNATRYYYQLCTTYKNEKKDTYNYSYNEKNYTTGDTVSTSASDYYGYVTSISAHPAGDVCYNLYADGASSYDTIKPMDATE